MRPTLQQVETAVEEFKTYTAAAEHLKSKGFETSRYSIRRMMNKANGTPDFQLDPDYLKALENLEQRAMDRLIRRKKEKFASLAQKKTLQKVVPINVNVKGPIGVGFFGDPHIDSDECNIELLLKHAELFDGRHTGLLAGNLGDVWDNWTGRLQRLKGSQSVTDQEALALVRMFLNSVDWLFYIMGNHDQWNQGTDLLNQILDSDYTLVKEWRAKMQLKLPNGRNVDICAAHDFPGNSQWHPIHGVSKRAMLDGASDIYVCGHRHVSGYTHGYHEGNDRVWHAVRVASYKQFDKYADQLNVTEQALYVCPVALIDPEAKDPINFIRWEFDPFEAAERLKWMRDRWENGKSIQG